MNKGHGQYRFVADVMRPWGDQRRFEVGYGWKKAKELMKLLRKQKISYTLTEVMPIPPEIFHKLDYLISTNTIIYQIEW